MEEYLGLLVSITEGLNFPKKKLYIVIKYSRYTITFPVVYGGETTVFNQGYFFRDFKTEGHDERDLPVLIQVYEKKTLFKNVLVAELKVEAFNFCNEDVDYYEPRDSFFLNPVEAYKDYSCQLRIMFQLVKQTAEFTCSERIDIDKVKPIGYQINILSAYLSEGFVDKKLYFSCKMNVNTKSFIKTRDIKGNGPQWNMRLIVAANEFSDKGGLVFVVNSVTHPHQQSSLAVVGEAKIPFKRIMSAFQFDFEIPILHKKKEIGILNVYARPIYPQSRDGTANKENISCLQPNAFPPSLNKVSTMAPRIDMEFEHPSPEISSESEDESTPVNPPTQSESTASEVITPLSLKQSQSQSQSQSQLADKPELSIRDMSNTPIDLTSFNEDAQPSAVWASDQEKPKVVTGIKKVETVVPIEEKAPEPKIYISSCTSIIRKKDSTRVQGLRLMNRNKHQYIESLSYVM